MSDITTPATEVEIAELITQLAPAGQLILRKLAYERDRLKAAPQVQQEPDDRAAQELLNIATAKRFDRSVFADDTEFADWAQSRCRHTHSAISQDKAFAAPQVQQEPVAWAICDRDRPNDKPWSLELTKEAAERIATEYDDAVLPLYAATPAARLTPDTDVRSAWTAWAKAQTWHLFSGGAPESSEFYFRIFQGGWQAKLESL